MFPWSTGVQGASGFGERDADAINVSKAAGLMDVGRVRPGLHQMIQRNEV